MENINFSVHWFEHNLISNIFWSISTKESLNNWNKKKLLIAYRVYCIHELINKCSLSVPQKPRSSEMEHNQMTYCNYWYLIEVVLINYIDWKLLTKHDMRVNYKIK